MHDYILMTDATSDLTPEDLKQHKIEVIEMNVRLGETDFMFHPDNEFDEKSFYTQVKQGEKAGTSQITTYTFIEAFTKIAKQGKDILYIGFASALSGTFQNAWVARTNVMEKYPDIKIELVDSLSASFGEGMIVLFTARKIEEGADLKEAAAYAETLKHQIALWFTVDDLIHLSRSGRLSNAAAMLGFMLQIKPLLHCDEEGHLIPVDKVRGRKASIKRLAEIFRTNVIDKSLVSVCHSDAPEEAELLRAMLMEDPEVTEVRITKIGPVIGLHSGPQTLAVAFRAYQR